LEIAYKSSDQTNLLFPFIIVASRTCRAVKMGNPPRVDHLVSQPNPTHLLASQKNSNPTRPGPLQVGRLNRVAHGLTELKKYNFFIFCLSQN